MRFTQKDKHAIERMRNLFPREIAVKIQRAEGGGFFAEILTFTGLYTESETFSELMEMVNDAVMTYLEIPKRFASYMPNYIPPLRMAQEFGAFPMFPKEKEIKLPLAMAK